MNAPKSSYLEQTGFLERTDRNGHKIIEIGFKSVDRDYDFEKEGVHNYPMATEVHAVAFVPMVDVGDRLLVNNVPANQGANLIRRIRSCIACYEKGDGWEGKYRQSLKGSTYELRRVL